MRTSEYAFFAEAINPPFAVEAKPNHIETQREEFMTDKRSKPFKGLSRRNFLKSTAAAGAVAAGSVSMFNINHAWSKDVMWDGEVFDAGGARFRLAEWPGFWQENITQLLLNDFEKDFNCKIEYDGSWPWFAKFVAGGADNPPNDAANWNIPDMKKTARAGDFFVSQEEISANVPNTKDLWPFATKNGIGFTWAFGQYCYMYRSDLVNPPPDSFKSFWEDRFIGKRATYVSINTLQNVFFMVAALVWGKDQYDKDAAFDALRRAMPLKLSDFTGNMTTLVERGEAEIAVHVDGEVYMAQDKGIPVGIYVWKEGKPLLTQTHTVSRGAGPMQKKLAYALLNRRLSPEFQTKFDKVFYLRPTNSKAVVPPNLAAKGVTNDATSTEGLWIPDWDWYLNNEAEITEISNEIFGG